MSMASLPYAVQGEMKVVDGARTWVEACLWLAGRCGDGRGRGTGTKSRIMTNVAMRVVCLFSSNTCGNYSIRLWRLRLVAAQSLR